MEGFKLSCQRCRNATTLTQGKQSSKPYEFVDNDGASVGVAIIDGELIVYCKKCDLTIKEDSQVARTGDS